MLSHTSHTICNHRKSQLSTVGPFSIIILLFLLGSLPAQNRELSKPGVLALVSPANGASVPGTSATFSWTAGTNSVTRYWLQVCTIRDATFYYNADVGNVTSKLVTTLPNNGSILYWRVRSYKAPVWGKQLARPYHPVSWGTWTPWRSFTNTTDLPNQGIAIVSRATKVAQLVGDYDKERQQPTLNLTWSRYKLASTDLGVPFTHNGRTYLLFGDTNGVRGGDAISYTTDTTPEDGLELTFIHDDTGYKPVEIPGISQGGFEVPMEGVSVGGSMYIYHTTDAVINDPQAVMGRSVVAVSEDDGNTFAYLYDLSVKYFINVSIVEMETAAISDYFNQGLGKMLVMFGSGVYRMSDVRLAFQPSDEITNRAGIRYFTGLDNSGKPKFSANEDDAQALFNQPQVGELSVSYNRFIQKWIMLYNAASPRGINMRVADVPWGPWSEPQVIFDPWADNGYCHFIHAVACDTISDPGRESEWGGEYGPYQYEDLATGDNSSTTIYFNMSTWNPYTVVLMKATLARLIH